MSPFPPAVPGMGEESQETPTHQRVSRQLATSETRLANFNRMLHVSELLVLVGWMRLHVVCVCMHDDHSWPFSPVSFRSVPRILNSAREMRPPYWALWMSCSTGWRKRWEKDFLHQQPPGELGRLKSNTEGLQVRYAGSWSSRPSSGSKYDNGG